MSDWLNDLADFDGPIVSEACDDWRRNNVRRPMPAELRVECAKLKNKYAPPQMSIAQPKNKWLPIPPSPSVREDWRNIPHCYLTDAEQVIARGERNEIMRNAGYIRGESGTILGIGGLLP